MKNWKLTIEVPSIVRPKILPVTVPTWCPVPSPAGGALNSNTLSHWVKDTSGWCSPLSEDSAVTSLIDTMPRTAKLNRVASIFRLFSITFLLPVKGAYSHSSPYWRLRLRFSVSSVLALQVQWHLLFTAIIKAQRDCH